MGHHNLAKRQKKSAYKSEGGRRTQRKNFFPDVPALKKLEGSDAPGQHEEKKEGLSQGSASDQRGLKGKVAARIREGGGGGGGGGGLGGTTPVPAKKKKLGTRGGGGGGGVGGVGGIWGVVGGGGGLGGGVVREGGCVVVVWFVFCGVWVRVVLCWWCGFCV